MFLGRYLRFTMLQKPCLQSVPALSRLDVSQFSLVCFKFGFWYMLVISTLEMF
jgi:hypothetical protein